MTYLAILQRALIYEMLSCSWFYRFRLFMFLVLQIPAFHVPGFLVPRSVPCSVPRFPVPCFTDSRVLPNSSMVPPDVVNWTKGSHPCETTTATNFQCPIFFDGQSNCSTGCSNSC